MGKASVNFGAALEAAKKGKLIQREGWNGKGMFVFQRPEDNISPQFINNIKSLPQAFKDWFGNQQVKIDGGQSGTVVLAPVKFTAYLCMKAADGSIVNGWLASQTDMLAEDWHILD